MGKSQKLTVSSDSPGSTMYLLGNAAIAAAQLKLESRWSRLIPVPHPVK